MNARTNDWADCTIPHKPGTGTVAVFRFSIDQPPDRLETLATLLSPDETARARRFAFEHLRNRYIAGRAGLRLALAAMIETPPQEIAFTYGANGKPRLDGSAGSLEFNLSHSRGTALIAVTNAGETGVDIEAINADMELDDIAVRFFSVHEQAAYMAHEPTARPDAFFRCWTRKEAIIKATGDGLSLPLDQFDVSIEPRTARLLRLFDHADPDDWSLIDIETGGGFAAAVAVRAPGIRAVTWDWDLARLPRDLAILSH